MYNTFIPNEEYFPCAKFQVFFLGAVSEMEVQSFSIYRNFSISIFPFPKDLAIMIKTFYMSSRTVTARSTPSQQMEMATG